MTLFLTEYRLPDGRYSDEVEALDWEHAQQIADERGKGETVIGEIVCKMSGDGVTTEVADQMLAMYAENGTLGED